MPLSIVMGGGHALFTNMTNRKPDPVLLGNAIVEARRKKNLTQQQLADALGVTNKTVSKWECGRGLPDQSMFEPLEQMLEIRVDDYVGEEPTVYYTRATTVISRVALITLSAVLVVCGVLLVVTSAHDVVVVHVCNHVCPTCGLCTSDCPDPVCAAKCNGHYDLEERGVYTFEAESCDYSDNLYVMNDAGSGKGYLGNFDFHDGETMTYRFSSRNNVSARLYFALVPRGIDDVCNDTFTVTVNGQTLYSRAVFRGAFVGWHNFVEYYIADIAVASGDNVIEVRYNINEFHNNGHNFDYIKLNTRPYVRSSDIVLEAEESQHSDSLRTRHEAGSGLGYLGDFDNNDGETLRFEFTSDVAEHRSMFFALATRGINDRMAETYTVRFNGVEVFTNSVVHGAFDGPDRWTDFKEYFVANVALIAGTNTLEVTFHSNGTDVKWGNNGHNFDYVRLVRTTVTDYVGNDVRIGAEAAKLDQRLFYGTSDAGKLYVGGFDLADLAEVRFFVHADVAAVVGLTLDMVPRGHNEPFADSFDIYVNGIAVQSDAVIDGQFGGFDNFVEYFIADIALQSGDNEILFVFKSNQDHNNGHNIGGISLAPRSAQPDVDE